MNVTSIQLQTKTKQIHFCMYADCVVVRKIPNQALIGSYYKWINSSKYEKLFTNVQSFYFFRSFNLHKRKTACRLPPQKESALVKKNLLFLAENNAIVHFALQCDSSHLKSKFQITCHMTLTITQHQILMHNI